MNRLFRTETPGTTGYLALAIFVGGYLAMMGLIVAPQVVFSKADTVTLER